MAFMFILALIQLSNHCLETARIFFSVCSYVMTAVSWWGHKVDNAYWLWSFQGKILKRNQCDKFCQLLWRPRLPTLLPEKKLKEIKKNLKKYSVEFDKVDSIRGSAKTKELLIKRKKMYEEYMAYRKKKDAQVIQRHSTYCHYNRVFF